MDITSAESVLSRDEGDRMATPIHVGLDVNQDTIAIAVAVRPRDGDALEGSTTAT